MSFQHTNVPTQGEIARAKAVSDGLPPMVAIATQISTQYVGNTVAYRGSGPIPPGLYHTIFTGEARPKAVTEKAKSSTIGPQAGRAVLDKRNGRYDLDPKTGQYQLRDQMPPKGLSESSLEISLRNIYNDLGTKYALITGVDNPDSNGVLRFRQIDHPSAEVQNIIYSVNINHAKPIPKEISGNYHLVSNHLNEVKPPPTEESKSPFLGVELDSLCVVSAQHHSNEDPQEIKILGGIVRDCDIDFMTNPTPEALGKMFGPRDYAPFLEPIDMSPHLHGDNSDEKEIARANQAKITMVDLLLEINASRWEQYEAKRNQIDPVDREAWELEHAHEKPFIEKDVNDKIMAAMVVTVGKGTPMQLYQALEINVIQQKILASSQNTDEEKRINPKNLDNPNIKNAELVKLHNQPISYSVETIAQAFIQHPSECHNEFYTSPRATSVAVSGDHIEMGNDSDMAKYLKERGEYVPINPKWIADNSPGNQNAKIWVQYFLEHSSTHYSDKPDVQKEVDKFLKNNDSFIDEMLEHAAQNPDSPRSLELEQYLTQFRIDQSATPAEVSKEDAKLEGKEEVEGVLREVKEIKPESGLSDVKEPSTTGIKLGEDFNRETLKNMQTTLKKHYGVDKVEFKKNVDNDNVKFIVKHTESESSQFNVEKTKITTNQPTFKTFESMFISFLSKYPDKTPKVTLGCNAADELAYKNLINHSYDSAREKMGLSGKKQEIQFSKKEQSTIVPPKVHNTEEETKKLGLGR